VEGRKWRGGEGRGREWRGGDGKEGTPNILLHPQFQFSRNMPEWNPDLAKSRRNISRCVSHRIYANLRIECGDGWGTVAPICSVATLMVISGPQVGPNISGPEMLSVAQRYNGCVSTYSGCK